MFQCMGKSLVFLFCLIISAVWCTFFEELKEVYVKESQDSPQKRENDSKLVKLYQKLLKAKCSLPPSEEDNTTGRRKRQKIKKKYNSELAVGVMLTYLRHALSNIHGITKRMALKRHYLHGGNVKRKTTWRLNKWAHAYATLKKEKHDKGNNDGQYKYLEKYRIPAWLGSRTYNWGLSETSEELRYVCFKIMRYILESKYNPSFLSNKKFLNEKFSLQTINFRGYVLENRGGLNCLYKSRDENERVAFYIVAFSAPQNYFAILDEIAILEWKRGVIQEYKTNLLDIVKLSDEKSLEDRNVIFDVVKSEVAIELVDLTADNPDPTNVASSSRTVIGPSNPPRNEVIVVDDELIVIDDDLIVIDDDD